MDACVIAPNEAINDNIIEVSDSMITISKTLKPEKHPDFEVHIRVWAI